MVTKHKEVRSPWAFSSWPDLGKHMVGVEDPTWLACGMECQQIHLQCDMHSTSTSSTISITWLVDGTTCIYFEITTLTPPLKGIDVYVVSLCIEKCWFWGANLANGFLTTHRHFQSTTITPRIESIFSLNRATWLSDDVESWFNIEHVLAIHLEHHFWGGGQSFVYVSMCTCSYIRDLIL